MAAKGNGGGSTGRRCCCTSSIDADSMLNFQSQRFSLLTVDALSSPSISILSSCPLLVSHTHQAKDRPSDSPRSVYGANSPDPVSWPDRHACSVWPRRRTGLTGDVCGVERASTTRGHRPRLGWRQGREATAIPSLSPRGGDHRMSQRVRHRHRLHIHGHVHMPARSSQRVCYSESQACPSAAWKGALCVASIVQ